MNHGPASAPAGTPPFSEQPLDDGLALNVQELAFWYRIPGINHEQSLGHLELVASQLIPRLRPAEESAKGANA